MAKKCVTTIKIITKRKLIQKTENYSFPFSIPYWHLLSFILWSTSKEDINNE